VVIEVLLKYYQERIIFSCNEIQNL